jgi:hypothetical protein
MPFKNSISGERWVVQQVWEIKAIWRIFNFIALVDFFHL